MRGDGTCSAVSRSIAEARVGLSCTVLFHHGVTEARRKELLETKETEAVDTRCNLAPANGQQLFRGRPRTDSGRRLYPTVAVSPFNPSV
jgi:hypothetical protein